MSYCKKYDCLKCDSFNECGGCEKNNGCPYGKPCFAALIIKNRGYEEYLNTETKVIKEINNLNIKGLSVDSLNILPGSYVNLEYPLKNGLNIKFLDDKKTYFANQIEIENGRCYGVVSDGTFILVSEYGYNGVDPKLILYKEI